jgi:hypothetical protein
MKRHGISKYFAITLLLVLFIGIVGISACAAQPTVTVTVAPTPMTITPLATTPLAAPAAVPTSLSEVELAKSYSAAQQGVSQYLYGIATNYHGKQVLAELTHDWYGGMAGANRSPDGSWNIEFHKYTSQVKGTILEPVLIYQDFMDSTGKTVGYSMVWHITSDGSKVTPGNSNAIRMEAELGK